MSDTNLLAQGLLEAFKSLNIAKDTTPTNIRQQQDPNGNNNDEGGGSGGNGNDSDNVAVTHDNNLPCNAPQRAGDGDNSDDSTATDSDLDVVNVVDTSSNSSIISYIHPSDLSIYSNQEVSEVGTIPETESENEEKSDDNESIIYVDDQSVVDMMDNLMSTPIKRKHERFSKTSNKISSKKTKTQSESQSEQLVGDVELESPQSPQCTPKVITTRSGRAVRQRIDHKFDYSSFRKQQLANSSDDDDNDYDDDEEDDAEDEDDGDEDYDEDYDAAADIDDEDDDDDDEDYRQQIQSEPTRKQRRISMLSNGCSSSMASSSTLDNEHAIIYVDLRQPVAIVASEPLADVAAVECDSELKTRLQKFLGLRPAQRRLYNPMDNYEQLDDSHVEEDVIEPRSRLWAAHNNTPATDRVIPKPTSSTSQAIRSLVHTSDITNDMKMLLFDDIVQRTNANCFESQTPEHIKEPIDLSGLPSEEQRAQNCQQHKKISKLLPRFAGVYSFVDSLRPETPISMCHPLAVYYRKRDFEASKVMLAKTLFNVLNHNIFHCGLQPRITWRSCMNMSAPSTIVHSIEAGGQRTSRIILWQQMKQPGMLIKALLHEMCHAAAFVYHGEIGHGDHCRKWAYRAKSLLPELPQIVDCNAKFKYTCLLCHRRSHGIIEFEDEEQQLRCHYCQFEVNVEKFDVEEAHALSFSDQLVTPYKQFMRENYLKCTESTHCAKMQSLNSQYKEQLLQQEQQQAAAS